MKFLLLLFLIGCATTANIHQGQEEEERNFADHYIGQEEEERNFADRYIGQEEEERNFAEIWEKVKQFFSDLEIDLKEKYMKFGEWVTNTVKEGIDKGASEIENIKAIAKEFIDNAENVSIDVAHEAAEFFSKHKKDLGPLWDKVKKVAVTVLKSRRG